MTFPAHDLRCCVTPYAYGVNVVAGGEDAPWAARRPRASSNTSMDELAALQYQQTHSRGTLPFA